MASREPATTHENIYVACEAMMPGDDTLEGHTLEHAVECTRLVCRCDTVARVGDKGSKSSAVHKAWATNRTCSRAEIHLVPTNHTTHLLGRLAPVGKALVQHGTPWAEFDKTMIHQPSMTFGINQRVVMGKYKMIIDPVGIKGEGASCICRTGARVSDDAPVAIKMYKDNEGARGELLDTMLLKFCRQVQVLSDLHRPCQRLALDMEPSSLFLSMIDYSKSGCGIPGPDCRDGVMYLVTDLAQFSLKEYIRRNRREGHSLSHGVVRSITKAIIFAAAGLHAKGWIHIDIKPENVMKFGTHWKLIDFDGCVNDGATIAIDDSSLSSSPCYCAPELASLLSDGRGSIIASPTLDAWSVGLTLCELVTLRMLMARQYMQFEHLSGSTDAIFLFLGWLRNIKAIAVPTEVERFAPDFFELVKGLLVVDKDQRQTCMQSLSNAFICHAEEEADRAAVTVVA